VEAKKTLIVKAIVSKKSNARSITIPDFKPYHEAIEIKITWYWHKNRQDKWNRIEDLEISQHR
jgi:hypothetical protein